MAISFVSADFGLFRGTSSFSAVNLFSSFTPIECFSVLSFVLQIHLILTKVLYRKTLVDKTATNANLNRIGLRKSAQL